jgi:hypothetical protein
MEGVGCRRPVGEDKGVVIDGQNGNKLELTAPRKTKKKLVGNRVQNQPRALGVDASVRQR